MKYQAGESGNPNGRPKGTGSRQQLFSSLVEPHRDKLFDTAINLALSGNESMLRLFLERMLPAKPTDDNVTIEMPNSGLKRTDRLLAYGEAILAKVSASELTPEQARSLMAVIEAQRKNIEASELDLRVSEIERTLKQRTLENRKK